MRRLFPSRLVIPSTVVQNEEMQALYNIRNRSERIRFAQKKHAEGYSINDIALLFHSATTTIKRYLIIPEDEIPAVKENVIERKHMQQMDKKKAAIEEVRQLYDQGHALDEISRLTGHTFTTITNYLKDDCQLSNGRYEQRLPGKLAPYERTVIELRAKGITYTKIYEKITAQGYIGTVASLRIFMQKERTHRQKLDTQSTEPAEYIPRKIMSQLIYRKLEDVKGLTQEQYAAAVKKYPVLGELYNLLKEFYEIIFSKNVRN